MSGLVAPLTAAHLTVVLRVAFAAIVGGVGFVALILLARRLSGALSQPLEFGPAVGVALLLAGSSWLLRMAAIRLAVNEWQIQALIATMTAITWTIMVALTLANMSPLAVLALWLPVVATEIAWRVLPRAEREGSRGAGEQGSRSGEGEEQAGRRTREQARAEAELPANVWQQLVRVRDGEVERVSGVLRLDFAAEEQTTALHLAFSPPLAREPRVELAAIDAAGVTVRATDCRTYGVRLEAKRGRETGSELSVLVKLTAISAKS